MKVNQQAATNQIATIPTMAPIPPNLLTQAQFVTNPYNPMVV